MSGIGHNNPPESVGPYAIYRHEKLKSMRDIGLSARHMTREADTPNADPARAGLNRVLVGGTDPVLDVTALIPEPGARDAQGKLCRRSNSVLVIEVFIGTSPEWWETATEAQQQDWIETSHQWLVAEYGEANIAHLRLHRDEKTPHLTGFIVPLDEKGHLNARRWIGGEDRCSQQQTDYAKAVEHLGLQRGIQGSAATHEKVRRHYGQIAQNPQPLEIEQPGHITLRPEKWAEQQAKSLNKQNAPVVARAKTAATDRTLRKRAEAQATKDRGRAERAEKRAEEALTRQKALAGRMRALPLPDVLDALGFEQDARERVRWRADGFNITLAEGEKAGKWFDHLADHGRGGAIDLVQHVMGTDFKGALAWLSDRFGGEATTADLTAQLRRQAVAQVKAAQAEREPFTPPPAAEEHWPHVARYLVNQRGLPARYVAQLHETGEVYADARRNAVFLCKDPETNTITGAELKGTVPRPDGSRFSGMAPGSRKDSGGFIIGRWSRAATVYLVESALDAISLMRLRQIAGDTNIAVMSTAGTKRDLPPFLTRLRESVRRVCGYDNDVPGEKAAEKLTDWERERPNGKDWNDDLRAIAGDGAKEAPPAASAAPEDDNTPRP